MKDRLILAEEKTLDSGENWLAQVLDSLNASIIITDPNLDDNPIIYANKRFYSLTGYSEEEVLGKNCRFLQGDIRDETVAEEMREKIKNGEVFEKVIKNVKKDGTEFMNKLYIAPVKNTSGRIINFVGVQHEVSE